MNTLKNIGASTLLYMLPMVSFAQGGGTTNSSTRLPNPLASGVDSIYELVVLVLERVVLPLGSVVIVFMIIYSGFLFVTARGNPDKISDARRMLLYVLIGAAILLGSVVIAQAINGTLCQIAPSLPGCTAPSLLNP